MAPWSPVTAIRRTKSTPPTMQYSVRVEAVDLPEQVPVEGHRAAVEPVRELGIRRQRGIRPAVDPGETLDNVAAGLELRIYGARPVGIDEQAVRVYVAEAIDALTREHRTTVVDQSLLLPEINGTVASLEHDVREPGFAAAGHFHAQRPHAGDTTQSRQTPLQVIEPIAVAERVPVWDYNAEHGGSRFNERCPSGFGVLCQYTMGNG